MIDNWLELAIAVGVGVGSAVLVALVVHLILRLAARRLAWARELVTAARRPFWTLLLWSGLWAGATPSLKAESWWPTASHVFTIGAIASVAWFLVALVNYVADLALGRNRIDIPHNIVARRLRTQTLITHRLVTALIVVIAIGAALFTFDAVRAVGASILASAGIISVVAGLAAQSVLSNMFAGIQLVFSNALRVDDVIVAEGEWGRVEEITLSYVVLHLWDDRRLVLPCTYFTTTPYQNWTRQGTELLGSVDLDLDWRLSPPAHARTPQGRAGGDHAVRRPHLRAAGHRRDGGHGARAHPRDRHGRAQPVRPPLLRARGDGAVGAERDARRGARPAHPARRLLCRARASQAARQADSCAGACQRRGALYGKHPGRRACQPVFAW